ncbi:MAG: signal peptidase [Pedosphaera sp.]|nr:signal peptidase [Pedosphaera sp.]
MDGETKTTGASPWLKTVVFGRNPKRTAIRLAILIIGTFILFKFVLIPIRITGISMEPTYHDGRVNFINRLAYRHSDPRRGDVVGIRYSGIHLMLAKRVVGLPGETVAFSNGKLYINGEAMEEPYLKFRSSWTTPEMKLKLNEYFVVGDNRSMPPDAHEHGAAEKKRIVGKVLL